ncbi:response regulator [Albimonas sp. CAU 1670]|uniref:response regulator transcription factor n=1 Tax=Albimonas sp. CAU 1670 TaxID=3032599 RepID=UPI0023DC55AB|nr:response regulator [Albimonas sp. CAU 1670]MDF2234098.1 response regulator [Albimonas sp. CAU 1670]
MPPSPRAQEQTPARPRRLVVVVEDDEAMRASIDGLLRSVGIETRLFASAQALLDAGMPPEAGCLVVDVLMPRISGLELQARLAERGCIIPIVFVTGYGDVPMAVQAMRNGALDVLVKPFRDQELIDAVEAAFARHAGEAEAERGRAELQARYDALTPREREVMGLIVRGRLNKQIAAELGIAEITVKVHRAGMFRKMGVAGVAELVRAVETLERQGD